MPQEKPRKGAAVDPPTDDRKPQPKNLSVANPLTPQELRFLIGLAVIAGMAELAIVIINFCALPIYLEKGLGLANLVGISLSVFLLAEALGNAPLGALSDRFGRKPMMIAGGLISVVTCLITCFLRVPPEETGAFVLPAIILVLRVLDGVGAALYWPAIFASVGDRIAPERQAQGMGALNIVYLVGIAFAPFISGVINENFGKKYAENQPEHYVPAFVVAAVVFGLIALLSVFIAPGKAEHPVTPCETSPEIATVASAVPEETAHGHGAPLDAVKRAMREIPLILLMGFLIFFSTAGLMPPYFQTFIMDRFDVSQSKFGTLVLYPAVLVGLLSYPLGIWCERFGRPRSIQLGLGIVAASLWGLISLKQEWTVIVIGCLLGIGFLLAFPSYMAHVSDLAGPRERAGMIGAVRMAQGIGALIGSALSSTLYGIDSQHRTIFACAAGLVTVGFVLSVFVIRPVERQEPTSA